jgi:hypothetical protein
MRKMTLSYDNLSSHVNHEWRYFSIRFLYVLKSNYFLWICDGEMIRVLHLHLTAMCRYHCQYPSVYSFQTCNEVPVSCLHSRNYVADDFALIAQLSQEAICDGDAAEVWYCI